MKKMPRFIFSIHENTIKEIKELAARRNISMALWVTRAIYEYIKKERLYDKK